MKRTSKIKNAILALIILTILVAIIGGTYARYSSTGTANADISMAKWHIKLGDEDISSTSKTINVAVSTATNENVTNGKIAPGSTLTGEFTVDPSGSEVAVDYILAIGTPTGTGFNTGSKISLSKVEYSLDGTNFTQISAAGSAANYSESLADVLANKAVTFRISITWDNDNDAHNVADTLNGNTVTNLTVPVKVVARQHVNGDSTTANVAVVSFVTNPSQAVAGLASGDTVIAVDDVTYDDYTQYPTSGHIPVDFPENATFDLKGKTITSPNGSFAYTGDNLTIKNGTFTGLISSAEGRYGIHLWNENENCTDVSENVVLENIDTTGICLYNTEVTLRNVNVTMPDDAKYYTVYGNVYSKVTIESGTYRAGAKTTALLGYCLSDSTEAHNVTENGTNNPSDFEITGGTFITRVGDTSTYKPLWLTSSGHGVGVIKGGSFDVEVTPALGLAEGYQCTLNTETGLYDVTPVAP